MLGQYAFQLDPWFISFAAAILILSTIFLTMRKRRLNLPPEVKGWPIVGYVPHLFPRVYKGFFQLKKDHPDIVTVHIGYTKFILIMSYRALKEAFITKGDNFTGRPSDPLRDRATLKSGLLFIDGPIWKEHRRFALRVLRDFGFGRNLSEQIVHSEVQNLLNYIDKKRLTTVDGINTLDLLLRSVSNVICTLTLGEQPGYEDKEFMEVINRMRTNISDSLFKSPFTMFPWLSHLGIIIKLSSKTTRAFDNIEFIHKYITTKIQKHIDHFDPLQEPRDYIEAFLLEQHKLKQREAQTGSKLDHTFTDNQLLRVIFELFVAGTDTTSNSLAWSLLLMALHQDVQHKCHQEIDRHIGFSRSPNMKDKQFTPYIMAVLDEVQRYTTLVPMGLVHRNLEEDKVMGYTIPANTQIVPFLYAIHHDPNVWEKPHEFHPPHFLTDGGLYQPRDELSTFMVGKRSCLGESLARVELYIFFVSLLQRYKVGLHPDDENRLEEIFLGSEGVIYSPCDHKILFHSRG